MRRLLHLCFLVGALLSGYSTIAQDRVVTGKVTSSEDGTPLVGVSVQAKGTSRGVNTDATGTYRLSVPDNSTLVFSFIGMITQEIAVGNQTQIDVQLGSNSRELTEVVVTGFGSQIKRDVTGNIAKVDSKKLENIPNPSFEAALQGNAAGVQITQGNGKLGQGISVRVRGTSSISASSQPLYVVDGVPINTQNLSNNTAPTNPIADLNPQDIESLEILKDASAGAIYGARAANGVVLITTKRGKAGKTNVNVGFQYGSSKPTNLRDYMTAQEWLSYFRVAAANTNSTTSLTNIINRSVAGTTPGAATYDWQKAAFQDAPFSQTDLNISGGNEKTKFYISGQYLDQKGILIKNSLERYTGRVNLDHKANNWLSIGMNMSLARTLQNRVSNDNAFSTPMQAVAIPPITPLIDPRTGLTSGTPPGVSANFPIYYNPFVSAKYSDYKTLVFRNISNVYGQVDFTKWLSFRSELGVDLLNQNENTYYGTQTVRNVSGAANGLGESRYSQVMNYNTNNYFSFNKAIGDVHSITATLGMSYQETRIDENFVEGQQFPSDAYRQIASAADITGGSSTRTRFAFLSYFLRANYKFADKYLVGLSGRVDGSSRFGNDSKYGFFPAVSGGWILSEEKFLQEAKVLSFLKLRASYGLTGNAEITNFPALGLWSSSGYAGVAGQSPSQLRNQDLKWETTTQTDIGLDYGILNNRINGEIDYYVKNTNDLLLSVNVPGTAGFTTQLRNIGKMQNKGFEFTLNSQNLIGAFKWSTSLNVSNNKNRVVEIDKTPSGEPVPITGGFDQVNRAYPGQPLGAFYMIEYAGVDKTNGDALYYRNDTEGDRTTTNDPDEAQRVFMGSPLPTWFGGITNTFSYAGFDLSILFNGQFGNKVYMAGGKFERASGDYFDNHLASELDYWTPENPNASTPEPRLGGSNGTAVSSRYLSDASYVRLRNISFGYTIPKPVLNRLKVDRLRVYFLAQNLLTFTKYTGWDPEVSTDAVSGNIAAGQDFYSAPQAKTLTVGLQIGF
ncbi:SusC/RagA family TonB-linked outer membrane protein [Siphonobacter sp. BAB-5385]|uniref:SusC/RagA family TonB-linked outer membrane protein n=2 Tax=unclassified Siphonobacter TaxID=2635712 RepID=UPI000B9DF0EC|nr:TonB-dependent receptor [Siphonobacter sp. BAB-5385]OZI09637.1 SusC/RagA family TonB-linked outer membrane protein [Siphonobacter sp. BAB-5385]